MHRLSISIDVAWISNGCFAFSVMPTFPVTFIVELIVSFVISLKFVQLLLKTIWTFLKKEPSFSSINPNVFESLIVLVHPSSVTSLFAYSEVFITKNYQI